ncbi:DUF898 family protein [Fibrella sp. USSR17]
MHVLRNRLQFVGTGTDYFGIYLVNLLLIVVTLGFYYPWAKAARLQYTYANTNLDNNPFQFHGTGREMFIGFIKAIGLILAFFLVIGYCFNSSVPALRLVGIVGYLAAILLITPIAIHGSLKYRLSRTSWQGIHFGYRGDRGELIKLFLTNGLLTIITLGLYSAWMTVNILRYTTGHVRFGSAKMAFTGSGESYFWLNVKGYILTVLTLGIYGFWWGRDRFDYQIDNLHIEHDDMEYGIQSSMTVGTFFNLVVVNVLLLVFTLGLAMPWVIARSLRIIFDNILIDERFEPAAILQTEADYRNATGDDLADILDISPF